MARATRLLGAVQPVNEYTSLISPADADRIAATVDAQLISCTRNEASSLVVELLGAYPEIVLMRNDRTDGAEQSYKLYTIKLFEAFADYSYAIGKLIVDGGKEGVPARQKYRPQPSDIHDCAKIHIGRLQNVKTMALRHKAEAERRAFVKAQEAREFGDPAERKARIDALVNNFKLNSIKDPVAARTVKPWTA